MDVNEKSNRIELFDAISEMRLVKLSEFADSITYLPLSNEHLLGEARVSLSKNYLFIGSSAFDWGGNYKFEIGTRGQGAGEEVYLHTIVEAKQRFYSMADKLIAYDSIGRFSGKERNVIDFHFLDMGITDTSGIVTCTLDSLYFWDANFDLKKNTRVVPDWPEKSTMFSSNRLLRFFTANGDSVLFYNYINDTVYRVLNDEIEPRWIINLKEYKIPIKYLLGNELKRIEEGAKYYTNGNLSDWEYLKDTDNKVRVALVCESDDYVFIYWFKLFDFWQLRQLPPTKFQIAYFDKRTSQTVAVKGDGFIDDISSLGTFYPTRGIYQDCMVTIYWPHELKERIDSLQKIDETIDPKLLNLLENMDEEDNPIVVMAHFKSQNQ